MSFNYIKTAVRYLLKNRTFSLINIFGLTVGFLCFILISLYLQDELGFDRFHKDEANIYRVIQHEQTNDDKVRNVAPIASRIAPESMTQLPEISDATRIFALGRITVGNDPVSRTYEPTITADENFFTFFDFPLLSGDPLNALKFPDALVLSESKAIQYFGTKEVTGKRLWTSLTRDGQPVEMIVTGVMKDMPKNSHLRFDMIFAQATWPTIFPWYQKFITSDWTSNTSVSYLKLKTDSRPENVAAKLTAIVRSNFPTDKQFKSTFTLQALRDIHLYSADIQGSDADIAGIKPLYLYMFGAVAILVLLIASLNYMNLSTAAAFKRTKEIGTRKALGAFKSQLISQFIGETIILSTLSLLVALACVQVLLPFINRFTQKELALQHLPVSWMAGMMCIVAITALISTLYPAFLVTRIKPSEALKKEIKIGRSNLPVRKLLVAGQFAIAILMIASTLAVHRQLSFLRSKDLGFTVDNLLVVDINSDRLRRNFENVKAEFASVSEVQAITTSTRVPGEWKSFPIASVDTDGATASTEMIYVGIDHDFLSTYNISLLEGRNFEPGKSDSLKVILTKLAVAQLNLNNPIGKIIEIPRVRFGSGIEELGQPLRVEVIGIADDFHFESFRQQMMPVIFAYPNTAIQRIDYYTLRIRTNDWSSTIDRLKAINAKIDPNNPLEYTFLDGQFEKFYKADEARGQIFLFFSSVVVMIACLGLLAIVSFSIEQRIKEIGIRKVLGASVKSIILLISKEFLLLVLIGGIVSLPIAFLIVDRWLEEFAYRIDLGPGLFIGAAVLTVIIAFATISIRTLSAATSNPVDALKNE